MRGRGGGSIGLSPPVRGSLTSPHHYLQEASPPICLYNGGLVWTRSIL